MRINLPKITKALNLRDYAPEMEIEITVLVNPPKADLSRLYELRLQSADLLQRARAANKALLQTRTDWIITHKAAPTDADIAEAIETSRAALEQIGHETNLIGAEIVAWMRGNWSQGPDEATHWSVEEIQKLVDYCADQDPALWQWLINRTEQMIEDYRRGQKKA